MQIKVLDFFPTLHGFSTEKAHQLQISGNYLKQDYMNLGWR